MKAIAAQLAAVYVALGMLALLAARYLEAPRGVIEAAWTVGAASTLLTLGLRRRPAPATEPATPPKAEGPRERAAR